MSGQVLRADDVKAVDDERHFEFITGFPCTSTTCSGRLSRGHFDGRSAVVCGVCEEVYYVVADS